MHVFVILSSSKTIKTCISPEQSRISRSTLVKSWILILGTFPGRYHITSPSFRAPHFSIKLSCYSGHMWDMSALFRRCENFGLFYNFCSRLVEALEYQDKAVLVGRHVNISNVTVPSVLYKW